jgi:hypothetical protein
MCRFWFGFILVLKDGSLVAFMELSFAAVDKSMAGVIFNTSRFFALVPPDGVACRNHQPF